ncbi:MAG: T9SS type A sorting domain-containing protein [Flavobacteriales bacterium]
MLKKLLFISSLLAAGTSIYSQAISDSVTLGPGYANQVFYKISDGTKTISSNTDWDLQFFSDLRSASIRTNNGVGVELYATASTDTTAFATTTLDTSTLTLLRGGYASWETDAFTSQQTGHPNYGWGNYAGVGNIFGNKVYAIKLSSGVFKKIWINSIRTNGSLNFTTANLDGTNLVAKTLNRSAYSTKRHFYYDVENDSVLDAEPAKSAWELVFRTYNDQVGPLYYNVTGALTNHGIEISQVNNTAIATARSNWSTYAVESEINVIGNDWKNFNRMTSRFEITDSLSYIIKDYNGDVYQLVFTGTSGGSTGKMYFTKELISMVSLEENTPLANFGIFPNPAVSNLTINFELLKATESVNITVIDVNGRIVKTINNDFEGQGFQTVNANVSGLNAGIYFVRVQAGNSLVTKKFIKQ